MFRLAQVVLAALALLVVLQWVDQGRYVLVGMAMNTYRVFDSITGRVYELPLNPKTGDPNMEHEATPPGNPKQEI